MSDELKNDPLQHQIGGTHYMDCAIQPVQYIEANYLGFLEGCVIKRVTRHGKPTGKGREDIEKAIHELQLILEIRYNASPQANRKGDLPYLVAQNIDMNVMRAQLEGRN